MPKALVLLSGGLDSLLAAKLLLDQGIKVTGLIFKSYFWDIKKAQQAAKQLGIKHKIIDFSQKHLKVVKKPPHGYGRAANPCIDCHILMLREAKRIVQKESFSARGRPARARGRSPLADSGWDFVATGEVLEERPFSQNKKALEVVAQESGLNDRLLRPLSARLLPSTLPGKKGWVKRENLLAIKGRSRKIQLALVKKYRFSFPQPAGGCILTEKEFAQKLFNLFSHWPKCDGHDIALLFLGRHFWCQGVKIVLGKNQKENEKLEKLAKKGDWLIKPENFPGPTALLRGKNVDELVLEKAKKLILKLTKKLPPQAKFAVLRNRTPSS